MIAEYERRAARLAALAACADDPRERRRFLEEKRECEQMIIVLKRIKKCGGKAIENDR